MIGGRQMTLRHLRIFIEVCRQNYNITRAAENLYISQPAVSLAIRELEEYYGVKLFERISRKLYITEVGKQMEEYAAHLLSMFDDMERGLRNWDSVKRPKETQTERVVSCRICRIVSHMLSISLSERAFPAVTMEYRKTPCAACFLASARISSLERRG